MRDIPSCKWLDQWTELAQKYPPPSAPVTVTMLSCVSWRGVTLTADLFGFQVCVPVQPLPAAQGPGGFWLHQQEGEPRPDQADHPHPQQGLPPAQHRPGESFLPAHGGGQGCKLLVIGFHVIDLKTLANFTIYLTMKISTMCGFISTRWNKIKQTCNIYGKGREYNSLYLVKMENKHSFCALMTTYFRYI